MSTASPTGGETQQEVSLSGGLFTRRATGLVREVSPFSTFVFNLIPSLPSVVLGISVFFALAVFPGGSLYGAYWIAFAVAAILAVAFGAFSAVIPRSGGDYVLVGRTLHPAIGLASSLCMSVASVISAAYLALALSTVGIAPGLSAVGVVSGSDTLVDWGATVQTSHAWQFGIGVAALVFITLVLAGGWRVTLRFQNWGVGIAIGGLALVALVLLFKSNSGFAASFDDSAGEGTYQGILDAAAKAGFESTPATLGDTWPVVGIVLAFSMFSWWSIHIAGEVRRANTLQITGAMVLASFTTMVILTICTAIFFKTFGHEFFGAINAINGTPDYPFGSPPYYPFLAALATGSTVLAVVVEASFVIGILVVLYVQLVQPTRALFAFAVDGILPRQVATVSRTRHVPVVAYGVVLAISIGVLAWAVWGASFFTVLAYAILFLLTAMTLLAIAATVLPYRRPQVYRASVSQRRVFGLPLLTLAGGLGILALAFVWYLFLHYPALGVTNRGEALRNVGIVAAVGVIGYFVVALIRANRGVSLAAIQGEIPPE